MAEKKPAGAPATATLLVELLTEELPPKSLRRLGEAFAEQLVAEIIRHRLTERDPSKRVFATPRRLAVLIQDVRAQGLDSEQELEGPVSSNGKAVEGFARKHDLAPESLERRQTPKGEIVVARLKSSGVRLDAVLPGIVARATTRLPVSRIMRWGEGEAQFVRPVHGLVMMHGKRVIPGTVLGVQAGNTTSGHRFMGASSIRLANADEYETKLRKNGNVIADFATRKEEIERQLRAEAKRHRAGLGDYQDLLDEVSALVEFPAVYAGDFDAPFLEIPQECLILTMRKNQKYFPLFAADGKLLPKFLIVSNMRVADPRHIVGGNERVVRPRLEDARFFFDQDRKARLEARVPRLAKVVYHNKLGSQLERVERIQLLAGRIARDLGADAMLAERAAWLSKADLLTGMVGEFPELQGTMGRYYALHDGEPQEVADAIEAHYRPRFAADTLPEEPVACAVALADKLDALAGLFGIGQQPTGEKDPFGLRRAALGVIRIVVERQLPLSLHELVSAAFAGYGGRIGDVNADLQIFMRERFSGYLKELGYSTLQVDAVLSRGFDRLSQVPRQLEAVRAFQALPESESLAAANKRVANILRQAAAKGESFRKADRETLQEPAEIALLDALNDAAGKANASLDQGDYAGYLKNFAVLKAPVDAFFDSVMVMVEQDALRRNRLALLADLREAMNRIADISKLAA
ncbi:MAG: glycine--tRNA ligase subunit beta [Burkholderiales bacterium]